MEKFHIAMDAWQDRLDSRWKQLPSPQKRRIVLYSFGGYLLVAIAIVIQVVYEVGNARERVGTEHGGNPVAGQNAPVRIKTNIQELNRQDNERGQKRESEFSGK